MTLEKDIKRDIVQWLILHGGFVWITQSTGIYDPKAGRFRKWHGTGRIKGVSDIIGIWKTRPLAIEVKKPGGRLRPEQQDFLLDFAEAGGIALVAYSVDDVIRELGSRERPGRSDALLP